MGGCLCLLVVGKRERKDFSFVSLSSGQTKLGWNMQSGQARAGLAAAVRGGQQGSQQRQGASMAALLSDSWVSWPRKVGTECSAVSKCSCSTQKFK